MRSEWAIYHPTVWRTCRALMNERRLRCLAAVLDKPGIAVKEVAAETGLPQNQASINLRMLQARGLITARRHGKWLRYDPEPDPLVEHANAMLKAVRRECAAGECALSRICRTLRAFTHARRLTILHVLAHHPDSTAETIVAMTRISQPAVCRHLMTLRRSGVVGLTREGAWRFTVPRKQSALARALLALIDTQ